MISSSTDHELEEPGFGELVKDKRAERTPSRLAWVKWVLFGLFTLAVFAVVVFAVMYQYVYRDRVFVGVMLEQADLSGMTREQASQAIDAELRGYLNLPIVLQHGSRAWQATPKELGAKFDQDAMLASAFAVGRNGGLMAQVGEQVRGLRSGVMIQPKLAIDQRRENEVVAALAAAIDRPALDAQLKLEGTNVKLIPAQEGYTLDRQALIKSLDAAFEARIAPPNTLPAGVAKPGVADADLQEAKTRAEAMLSGPLTVSFAAQEFEGDGTIVSKRVEKNWSLSVDQIAAILTFASTKDSAGRMKTDPVLNQEKLKAFGEQIAKEVDRDSQNARFSLQDGKLVPILASRDKRTVDVDRLVAQVQENATKRDARAFALPVQIEKPPVSVEDASRIVVKDKIVERSTPYTGSTPERAHNVRFGASQLNGVTLAPGQEFSFLQEVGEISQAAGYQMGFAIIGADTVPDPGGGICQVSTTLFQSVFYGGYEIQERYPHAYRMKRYEPPAGLDSTIYEGQLDLRFRNSSNDFILIQSRSDESRVYFSIYGVKPDWEVKVDGPYLSNVVPADPTPITRETPALAKGRTVQVEEPVDGVDVTIKRKVIRNGEVLQSDSFFSRYRPEGNVVLVGTG